MQIDMKQIDKLAKEVHTTQKEIDLGCLPHGSVVAAESRIQGIRITCRLLGIENMVFNTKPVKKPKKPKKTVKIDWKAFDTTLGLDMLNDFAVGNYSLKMFCELLDSHEGMGPEVRKMKRAGGVKGWRNQAKRAYKRLTGNPVYNFKF